MSKSKFIAGFTLVELLLVVAIIAIVFLFSSPYALNFYKSNIINDARNNVISALEKAKHNAILQKNDSNFGVYFSVSSSSYTLFQTPDLTWNNREVNQDIVYPLVNNIAFSTSTVIFNKLTGLPNATGTLTFTYDSLSRSILINDGGVISKVN